METDCAIAKIVSSHLERFARYPGEASMTEILTSDMTIAPICLAPRRGAGKLEQTSAATPRVPNRSLRAIVHGTQCVTAGFTVSRDAEDCWQDELSEYFFFFPSFPPSKRHIEAGYSARFFLPPRAAAPAKSTLP